jgi:hypothetical protein
VSAADIAIDTLTFQDLLRIGLEDIPGASRGEWTLHGPVDPGISMLELLAWQLEQRLFMGEQTTEPMLRAGLRLLGLPAPAPARAAATVLSIAGPAGRLPAGTVFGLDRDTAGRRFALAEDVWIAPVAGVRVSGRMHVAGDALELELDGAGAAAAGTRLSLLVDVEAAPGVVPAWLPGAAGADPPAELAWTAIGPDGASEPVAVTDTTGALRRSGLLRLAWPDVFERAGTEPRRLRAAARGASYTEPVRIAAVHANAAVARQRVPATASVDLRGLLPLPGQVVAVPGAARALCDDELVLTMAERDGATHEWQGVRTWVGSGPGDRVVLVDRERGELRFGDGRSGRVPRPAADGAAVHYALGAGDAGNVGPLRGWAQEAGAATAVNPLAADGGSDPETLAAARQRAADALATPDRTVTAADAVELAVSTPGLGLRRAHASAGFHPGFPCVATPGALSLTIVPHADRQADPEAWTAAPQPDAGAVAGVLARLRGARLLGQEVFVLAPRYRAVTVDVTVSALTAGGDERASAVAALRRHLDALVGGGEGEGWPFGAPVRPSELAGVVQDALGPEATVSRLSVALDGGEPSDCSDLPIGPRELVHLAAANVTVLAAAPTGGGLR